ncbi:MAG: DUF4157 domain-containing protein [Spirulina sp. SIO3F2]|nr:DUF4157 domain-containing protein [Spirulina sp. SIO3F2]
MQRQIQIDHHSAATVQADVGLEGGAVSGDIESTINSAKSSGQALSAKTQTSMGGAMGADFSSVKVHTDSTSDQLNRSMQSRAFTTGSHIFFKKGEYSPGNRTGQELLAHELTHTVQQGASPQVQQQALPQPTSEPNRTGMPLQLKAGVESLSGMSMSDVKVHYNSPEPTKIGALAYTQGTDIHLAPKQEQHLAHEAWHVVQQKQGRVPVTTQFKKLAGNDSPKLEREADVMGAKASAFKGTQPVGMVQQQGLMQRQVVQARLPQMTDEQILQQTDVVTELLLHSVHNMENTEAQNMLDQVFPKVALESPSDSEWDLSEYKPLVIDTIKNPSHSGILVEAYHYIQDNIGEEKKFDLESPEDSISGLQQQAIAEQLPRAVSGINAVLSDGTLRAGIFGPDYNEGKVTGTLIKARQGIQQHISNGSCPAVLMGNQLHNQWVGVGAMTSKGAEQVSLGSAAIKKLAGGTISGLRTLVHEFTHVAGTKDTAYSISGAAKLTPTQRVKNAFTYEVAFAEKMGVNNAEHFYDEDVVTGKKSSVVPKEKEESGTVLLRKHCVGVAAHTFSEAFNRADNTYLECQRLFGSQKMSKELEAKVRVLIKAATIPFEMEVDESNYKVALALIEDRVKLFGNLANKRKLQIEAIKKVPVEDLRPYEGLKDNGSSIQLAALMVKDYLNLDDEDSHNLMYYMEDFSGDRAVGDYS